MWQSFGPIVKDKDEKILFKTVSPLSGEIVVKDTYLGRELIMSGSTHSIKTVFPRANYWEYCVTYSSVKDGDKVLVLGLGGGEIIRRLLERYNVSITVVEMDPVVISIYNDYFKEFVNEEARKSIKIVHGDAFEFATKKGKNKYNVIIGDVYNQNSYDNRLLEDSFLRSVKNKLVKEGQFISNRIFIYMPKIEIEKYTKMLNYYFGTVYSKYVADEIFTTRNYVFFANKTKIDQ